MKDVKDEFIPEHSRTLTKDEIKKIISDNNVEFIRLQFCDINGTLKNLAVPASQIDKALNNEMMLDGSSIKGFRNIETSDMYFYPDLSTFTFLPWRGSEENRVARLICDIHNADGTPFEGCPRCNLKRVLKKAKDMGYVMNIGPEAEFFVFKKDADGNATTIPHDNAGYYDTTPLDLGENLRGEIVKTLHKMGFKIEASHHEGAQGQHEIDFKYSDALTAADDIITFKYVVKSIAQQHGAHATFMPKPIYGVNGSGMHCNVSLFKDGKNVFFAPDRVFQLSKEALWTIGGMLKHVKSFTAVTNPTVNSYKRLVPGYEAPVYVAWSLANRSALIRVPAKRGSATRVELRSPDPSCNPYLALAVMLGAILDGVENRIEPPLQIEDNIYEMTPKELKRNKIDALPGTLLEALNLLEKSDVAKAALGEHILAEFLAAKRKEWDRYRTCVTPWEIAAYLVNY